MRLSHREDQSLDVFITYKVLDNSAEHGFMYSSPPLNDHPFCNEKMVLYYVELIN